MDRSDAERMSADVSSLERLLIDKDQLADAGMAEYDYDGRPEDPQPNTATVALFRVAKRGS